MLCVSILVRSGLGLNLAHFAAPVSVKLPPSHLRSKRNNKKRRVKGIVRSFKLEQALSVMTENDLKYSSFELA